jgi:hypothetical protein
MNMAYNLYQDQEAELDARLQSAGREKLASRSRRSSFRSRRGPVSVNGIHRRRNKKFTW